MWSTSWSQSFRQFFPRRDVLVLSNVILAFQTTSRHVSKYLRVLDVGAGVIGLCGSVGSIVEASTRTRAACFRTGSARGSRLQALYSSRRSDSFAPFSSAAFFGGLLGVEMVVAIVRKVSVPKLAEWTELNPVVVLSFLVFVFLPVLLVDTPAEQCVMGALVAFSCLRFGGLPAHEALIVGSIERDSGER
jgi:hypothetical protein